MSVLIRGASSSTCTARVGFNYSPGATKVTPSLTTQSTILCRQIHLSGSCRHIMIDWVVRQLSITAGALPYCFHSKTLPLYTFSTKIRCLNSHLRSTISKRVVGYFFDKVVGY